MDDEELVAEIWSVLYDRLGEDLRAVTRYRGNDYETKMRKDVEELYTDLEDQQVVSSTIVNQLSQSELESAFKLGKLQGLVRIFDDAWVINWPDAVGEKRGIIVSIQRDGGGASMNDIGWCVEYIEQEIEPLIE